MAVGKRKEIQDIVDAAPEQLKYKILDELTGANRLREARREKYKDKYEQTQKHKRRAQRDSQLTSEEITQWFKDYKSTLVCKECGESNSDCLAFHHVDPATKKATVASMVRSKSSKQEILDEIAKCVVLCSNCHLKRHGEKRRE